MKGSQSFFRRSLEKVHASKKCPLCTRGFADEAGLERVIKSVSKIEAHVFDGTSRETTFIVFSFTCELGS